MHGLARSWLTKSLAEKEPCSGLDTRFCTQIEPAFVLFQRRDRSQFEAMLRTILCWRGYINEYEIDTVFHLAAQPLSPLPTGIQYPHLGQTSKAPGTF